MEQLDVLDLVFTRASVKLKRSDETLWSEQSPDNMWTADGKKSGGSPFFDTIADKVLELAPRCDVVLLSIDPECGPKAIRVCQLYDTFFQRRIREAPPKFKFTCQVCLGGNLSRREDTIRKAYAQIMKMSGPFEDEDVL